jgi:hypothetical protein
MHPETCPAGAGGMSGGKPRWEVADVFRRYGDDYRRAHRLSVAQRKGAHVTIAAPPWAA